MLPESRFNEIIERICDITDNPSTPDNQSGLSAKDGNLKQNAFTFDNF